MNQTDIFISTEGDAWFERNKAKLGQGADPVLTELAQIGFVPRMALEIGCANGWRLKRLKELYQCGVWGVDPSLMAIEDAGFNTFRRGVATHLPFQQDAFDLVIFGFCLYLIEPRHLFEVVGEADRVLQNDGRLVIYDFATDGEAYATKYAHHDGVLSYHIDHARMFLAHPWYHPVKRARYGENMVSILRKSTHITVMR